MDVNEIEVKDAEVVEKSITIPLSQIDALPNNDKLGEYVRSLRNKIINNKTE